MFQSTHPRGVRRTLRKRAGGNRIVSIHAPAWGATAAQTVRFLEILQVSIHAPAWGATRPDGSGTGHGHVVSIHAPAWGATSTGHPSRTRASRFNPRTRVGCDVMAVLLFVIYFLFQSTHPRGVRHVTDKSLVDQWYEFQSTHPRGVRRHRPHIRWPPCGFQSTHPRGVRRPGSGPPSRRAPSFNPRTRVGCDAPRTTRPRWPARFQSTHPRGVRL